MPKRRKPAEIATLRESLQESNVVQKSRPLFSLWKSELTLAEFKILDTYLSRINSHKPELREVRFDKGELEKLLGVTEIRRDSLEQRLIHLQRTVVNIGCDDKIDRITLFERAQGEQDEYGIWQIKLTCTPSAMKYIFDIEHLGYLRYQIRSIAQISSLYSYILFTYLEYNRFRKTWVVSIEELKDILNCTSPSYDAYKEFNDKILKRCYRELHEKTAIKYAYEPIKRGRKVVSIRFTLGTLSDQLEGQLTFKGFEPAAVSSDNHDADYASEQLAFLAEACNYEFEEEEMRVLFDLLIEIIPYDSRDGLERFDFLRGQYNLLQMYSEKRQIKNRFSYLKKLIENKRRS